MDTATHESFGAHLRHIFDLGSFPYFVRSVRSYYGPSRPSRRRSGPLSTRRNAAVPTRDPVVGPNGLKRTSENPGNPSCNAPYQKFQWKIGHSTAPGLTPLRTKTAEHCRAPGLDAQRTCMATTRHNSAPGKSWDPPRLDPRAQRTCTATTREQTYRKRDGKTDLKNARSPRTCEYSC